MSESGWEQAIDTTAGIRIDQSVTKWARALVKCPFCKALVMDVDAFDHSEYHK